MAIYKIPITTAFIVFPIIAFIFTLPYLIYQYRKYGAVLFLRSVIVYSFILYLLSAYFLVILPLPSIEEVKNLTTPTTQLMPFHFLKDLSSIPFNWKELSSYLNIIKNPTFYISAFNILLTIPFGIYLRYYFECKWYKAFLLGFLLSLFFELTQLSGLYRIYPRPYRLFEVDDLILNTLGTMIGFLITPLFTIILPTRKELDEKSFEKGKKVTIFRRALSYCIDFFFLVIMFVVISILIYNTPIKEYSMLITIFLYYLILPLLTNGKTIGKMILKLQVIAKPNSKFVKMRVEARYLLSYILFYYQFVIINLLENFSSTNNILNIIINSSIIILRVYFWLNILNIIFNITKKNKNFLYEKLTKTETVSTIKYQKEEQEQKIEDSEKKQEDKKLKKKSNQTKIEQPTEQDKEKKIY